MFQAAEPQAEKLSENREGHQAQTPEGTALASPARPLTPFSHSEVLPFSWLHPAPSLPEKWATQKARGPRSKSTHDNDTTMGATMRGLPHPVKGKACLAVPQRRDARASVPDPPLAFGVPSVTKTLNGKLAKKGKRHLAIPLLLCQPSRQSPGLGPRLTE